MRNAKQKKIIGMSLNAPVSYSSPVSDAHDLQDFVRIQLQQLATQLPAIAIGILYEEVAYGEHKILVSCEPEQDGFETITRSYLESCLVSYQDAKEVHEGLTEGLLGQLNSLTLIVNAHPTAYLYGCPLSSPPTRPEFCLVWVSTALSVSQQQYVVQSMQLMRQHLKLYKEQVRQQTELQLMEQMIQKLEHQLRNPLAVISLYAETLYLGSPTDIVKEQASVIRETANSLKTHLTDLTQYGQQARLQLETHDLQSIIQESIQGLQPWLTDKQLQITYPDSTITLAVDRWQIKQAFDNILTNAVQLSPQGGAITLSWQSFQQELLITIADQGPGISETDLHQIFQPFYSRRSGGTGLGLAIAKKIILDHHGSVWAENLTGSGAQFCIILPRHYSSAPTG